MYGMFQEDRRYLGLKNKNEAPPSCALGILGAWYDVKIQSWNEAIIMTTHVQRFATYSIASAVPSWTPRPTL